MTSVYAFNELREEVDALRKRVELLELAQFRQHQPVKPYQPGPTINGPVMVACPVCGPHSTNKACGNAACPLAPTITC